MTHIIIRATPAIFDLLETTTDRNLARLLQEGRDHGAHAEAEGKAGEYEECRLEVCDANVLLGVLGEGPDALVKAGIDWPQWHDKLETAVVVGMLTGKDSHIELAVWGARRIGGAK